MSGFLSFAITDKYVYDRVPNEYATCCRDAVGDNFGPEFRTGAQLAKELRRMIAERDAKQ